MQSASETNSFKTEEFEIPSKFNFVNWNKDKTKVHSEIVFINRLRRFSEWSLGGVSTMGIWGTI